MNNQQGNQVQGMMVQYPAMSSYQVLGSRKERPLFSECLIELSFLYRRRVFIISLGQCVAGGLLINMLLSQIVFFASCLRILRIPDFHSKLVILELFITACSAGRMSQRMKELCFFL